jgi:hypothetical protein
MYRGNGQEDLVSNLDTFQVISSTTPQSAEGGQDNDARWLLYALSSGGIKDSYG